MSSKIQQTIRYVRASDGVRIAWAESGGGPTLVKAATWLTHLEYDLESPVWQHWTTFLSKHFRYVRYDERGCGMTDWDIRDLSTERRVADLETVIDAAGITEPITLLGMPRAASQSRLMRSASSTEGRAARLHSVSKRSSPASASRRRDRRRSLR